MTFPTSNDAGCVNEQVYRAFKIMRGELIINKTKN